MTEHKIQVEQCDEGTHILCICGALFEKEGLPALLIFLETHSRLPLTSILAADTLAQDQDQGGKS